LSPIGIVVISHGSISADMVRTVQAILDDPCPLYTLGFEENEGQEDREERLAKIMTQADEGSGVLLMVDLLGATPCKACRSFLQKGKVALVTGYNLPMLMKVAQTRHQVSSPEELSEFICDYGQKNITIERA
jgi:mannose PTS system EIIA component